MNDPTGPVVEPKPTGMTADEIAAAVAAVNALTDVAKETPPALDETAIELARRKLERAEEKRARRAEKLAALAEAGAIGVAEQPGGVRKLLQFAMKFDALLSPGDAEKYARGHLFSIGLRVHDVYATAVRKSDTRVLRPDQTQALEEYEFHAEVTIPDELLAQFEKAAADVAAAADGAGGSDGAHDQPGGAIDEPAVRDTETGNRPVEAGSRPE